MKENKSLKVTIIILGIIVIGLIAFIFIRNNVSSNTTPDNSVATVDDQSVSADSNGPSSYVSGDDQTAAAAQPSVYGKSIAGGLSANSSAGQHIVNSIETGNPNVALKYLNSSPHLYRGSIDVSWASGGGGNNYFYGYNTRSGFPRGSAAMTL